MNRQQRRAAARRGQTTANSPAFYANHGLALQNLGRLDEAVSSYDRAIALDPNLFEVHYNRANALRDLGLLDDAIASYERAIELKPGIAEAYSNRASALRDLRRLEEAVQSYDEAVSPLEIVFPNQAKGGRTWEATYANWKHDDVKYYWRNLPLRIKPTLAELAAQAEKADSPEKRLRYATMVELIEREIPMLVH